MLALTALPRLGLVLMLRRWLTLPATLVTAWLGRMALYPMQLPAGSVASALGGGYLLGLLLRRRVL